MYGILIDVTQKMRHDLSIGKVAAAKTGVFVKDFFKYFLGQLLLMAEILHHLGCRKPKNYQPQLVGRIFSINSMTEDFDFKTHLFG